MLQTIRSTALTIAVAVLLAACAAQPSPQELGRVNTAVEPSSQTAAEQAVKAYFDEKLIDPESARYTYLHYQRGWMTMLSTRYFGVFMCGTINAKNRMGGYTGRKVFLAFFSPYSKDVVQDGVTDDGKYSIVGDRCLGIYGRS